MFPDNTMEVLSNGLTLENAYKALTQPKPKETDNAIISWLSKLTLSKKQRNL